MQSHRSTQLLSLAVVAALLAGCGGGHHATSALPASPSGAKSSASVAFRITIPSRSGSATSRSPRYISASTQSVAIVVNGGAPQVSNLTTSSPNCTGTPLTCTVTIAAPAGTDTFDFTTYDQTNGTGNALSHSSFPQTITPGVAQTVNATLGGVVASVTFTGRQWTESITEGTGPKSLTYTIKALDAAGNAIIGPYESPVTVNVVDPDHVNAITLSTTSFNQNGDSITAAYNGTAVPDGVTLQFLSGGNAPIASATIATFPAALTGGAAFPASMSGLLGWYDGQDLSAMNITFSGNVPTITKLLDKSGNHADLPAVGGPNPTYDAIGGAEQRGSINFDNGSCLGPATNFPINGSYSIVVLEKPTPNTNIVVGGGFNETSALQGHALFFDNGQANNTLAMYQTRSNFVTGGPMGAGTRLIEADYQNGLQGILYSDLGAPSASNPAVAVGNGISLDNTIAAGNTVTATINGTSVSYTETAGDTSATTAQGLAALINGNATLKTIVTATASTYDTGGANPVTNGLVLLTPVSPTAMTSLSATGTGTKASITGDDTSDTSFYLNCFAGGPNTAGANRIEEAMFFNHALSATERKNLQIYFNRKWGLGYGTGF